ncbi:MAG: type II toxin-antitoxin system HicB family antitoxin [Bdellovibrionales bacterium]
MAIKYYPAILEKGEDGYYVFFPDVLGCTSAGDTQSEAVRNAEDALRGHFATMIEDGEPLPEPSSLDAIENDPDVKEAARVLIRAELPGKFMRLNISLDEGLVSTIDSITEDLGLTRSGFLAIASRDYIARKSHDNQR